MDPIVHGEVDFMNPFLALTSEKTITDGLVREFTSAKNLPAEEIKNAAHAAWEELAACRQDIRKKGEETLAYMEKTGTRGIVLAGRPYHYDPEVNHGIRFP